MAAVLLTAGEKGKRYALPHASVMIHQPLGGAQGQATGYCNPCQRNYPSPQRAQWNHRGPQRTDAENCHERHRKDNFMTADAALKYGLIDKILTRNELAS